MRVAALYDIHGNLPALEAALAAVRAAEVDLVVVGGDVVPGPLPSETMASLRKLEVPVRYIFGNGETAVLTQKEGKPLTRVPEAFQPLIHWTAEQLSAEDIAAFATWPLVERLDIPGLGDVVFCHATPRDDNEIFTRLTPEERLKPIFDAAHADVVVCGHTHMQFDRTVGKTRVINAGSVGMPFGKPGAYWLLLGPAIALRHTAYDYAAAEGRLATAHYPMDLAVREPPSEAQMLEMFEAAALR